jgi:hypothetical protein
VDATTQSILFLTDEGDQPARIGFSVTVGDTHYYLTSLMLAPRETRAIDLRQLRDAQVADFKGNKIPAGAADGSVDWVRLDNVPVMGRVAVMMKAAGMASSYDCCTCACPLSFMGQVTVSPASFALLPTQTEALSCSAKFEDCNYYVYWYDDTSWAWWSSSDTSVVKMDTSVNGQADAQSGGTATVTAQYTDCGYWYYNALTLTCDCSNNNTSGSGSATGSVVTVTISGPSAVPLRNGGSANGVNTVQLTANVAPSGGSFSWSTTSNSITLSNTTSATATVTSVAASTSQGDTPVKVTYTYSGRAFPATSWITVQKPSVLIINGPDTTTSESTCNAGVGTGCGVARTFTYQVLDQIGGGEPINSAGMQIWDSITTGSVNQLGLTGYITTCTNKSAGTNSGPCGVTTSSSGEWLENSLGVCSTFCYSSGTCVSAGETTASQVWYVNGFALPAQQITYECNKVLVNGG